MSAKKILLATLLLLCGHYALACPSLCMCKWKNGKQTVECADKELVSIPGGMDAGTQVLDMSGNQLDELHSEIFLKMDLINLQRIYLARCRIHNVDERAFKGLTNLVELDLSGNLLETIPTDALLDCPSLMRLTLNANPIKMVKRASFARLAFLNTLEVSDCRLEDIELDAFQGLHSLEWLRLDGNQLKTVRDRRVLPDNLRGIELQGNPWECDCHLRDLRSWLDSSGISVSQSVEPTCHGPARLAKRLVKSIAYDDLACLPDISPTSIYLEIGEGRNLSLLCNIRSVPEARVSWHFQGQLLQNDSLVTPGLRLLYFIEEGSEADKRSELFIYNTNTDDNGTYICSAENPAGAVNSNYTIRIIVKEDPIVIVIAFPFEYLLAAIVSAAIIFLITIITVIVCVVKCRRNRKLIEQREKTKEVALQYQQNSSNSATKCAVLREDNEEQLLADVDKHHNANEMQQQQQQEPLFYGSPLAKEHVLRTMSPLTMAANQMRSPISLGRYQLEQNPDLINDTESRRRDDDHRDCPTATNAPHQPEQIAQMMHRHHPATFVQVPISCLKGSRKLYSLHSWDAAACPLDSEGYPADYGLPKIVAVAPPQSNVAENFYRTLPHNRAAKRQSAANPQSRFSREAEFLSRSTQPAPYEHYCADVRYTADGLPQARPFGPDLPKINIIPSPPEGYKNVWPNAGGSSTSKCALRCVGAQTEAAAASATADETNKQPLNKTEPALNEPRNEISESPDEGYVGEPIVL